MSNREIQSRSQEKKLRRPYKEWKVGELDHMGRYVSQILSRSKDYIIYEAEYSKRLTYSCRDSLMKRFSPLSADFQAVADRFTNDFERKKYLRPLAAAYTQAFENRPDKAKQILNKIFASLEKFTIIVNRVAFLVGAACPLATLTLFGFALFTFHKMQIAIGMHNALAPVLYSSATAAFGGFLSVFLRINELSLEDGAGIRFHLLIGTSRSLIAIGSGIVAYFLVDSGMLFHFLTEGTNQRGIYVVSCVAGFSEKFIPNVLETLQKT